MVALASRPAPRHAALLAPPASDARWRPPRTRPLRATLLLALLSLLLPACGATPARADPETAVRLGRELRTTGGAVACEERHAAEVGARVLARGGNATDAAVAMAFALAVTWPPAGALGGGGLMLVAGQGDEALVWDFRETAPAAVAADLFLGADGAYDPALAEDPWRCVGVPGTPAGLFAAHAGSGRLPWRELLAPAIALASAGFVVDETLEAWLAAAAPGLAAVPASAAIFLGPDGAPPAAGELLVQADLAATLTLLAEQGPEAFYRGPLAAALVSDVARHGGLLTLDDLAAYQPVRRPPLRLPFAGHVVLAPPPPSAGGVVLGQLLGQLERLAGRPAADAAHLYVEASRQAFADRARWLGDPAFSDVPVEALLDPAYLDGLVSAIDGSRARDSRTLGPPLSVPEPLQTTHLSVVDGAGDAVSLTLTLEDNCGGKAVVAGTGLLLNNQLRDFNRWPGVTDEQGLVGTAPNLARPGARPLTSMTPVVVLREGTPVLATGSPGGRTIPSTVSQVLLRAVGRGEDLLHAVDGPRLHHPWLPDQVFLEAGHEPPGVREDLVARGHLVTTHGADNPTRGLQGAAHSVAVDPATGLRRAVADWRRDGWAAVADPPRGH